MNTAQLLLDGSEEAPAKERAPGGFREFMQLSKEEEGLFLPAQAAIALDVHPSRIGQLMDTGAFRTWDFFGKRYLSCREVLKRRHAEIKTGRPKRTTMQKIGAAGRMLAGSSVEQILSGH